MEAPCRYGDLGNKNVAEKLQGRSIKHVAVNFFIGLMWYKLEVSLAVICEILGWSGIKAMMGTGIFFCEVIGLQIA